MDLFGKRKKEENLSDIPELPPLDLDQVPTGPPLTGAPERLEAAETSQLIPGAPPMMPPPAPSPPLTTLQPSPVPFMEAPSPPSPPSVDHVRLMTEDVEKIAEDIIDEKWTKLVGELNEIKNWKDTVAGQIDEVKESISKLDTKINDVQKAILGKVGEYNQSIKDVNVELKAMSKVFEKVLPTFTDNVKKLSEITSRAKSTPLTTASRPKGGPRKK